MIRGPLFIQDANLSHAWLQAFLEVIKPGVQEILPLVLTVTGFVDNRPVETSSIKQALDDALMKHHEFPCNTVANTIFPQSLWNPQESREKLFERYRSILPSLKQIEARNKYGLYFQRLIAFGPNGEINQLQHVINTYHSGNHRRSSLQASVFDPSVDHTHQRQRGFPCMQHVIFVPYGDRQLAITGFYASQYLFERAYGNYLGLCNLGRFMAHELDLRLTQMTCVVGVAKIGDINKGDIQDLVQSLENIKRST